MTTSFQFSEAQSRFIQDPARFTVWCAGRRVGKTYAATAKLLMRVSRMGKGDVVAVGSKSYKSVSAIWMRSIRDLFPQEYISEINRAEMRIDLVNGCTIYLFSGSDNSSVDNMRGFSLSHVILDEAPFWGDLKYAWSDVIRPALADKQGTADIVSSPNGKDQFYDMFTMGQDPEHPEWSSHHSSYKDAYLDTVIEEARMAEKELDSVTFAREWLASFEGSGKSVYYAFDRAKHTTSTVQPVQPGELVRVGIDFNVALMASVVFVQRGSKLEIVDEIMGAQNTPELIGEIKARYPNNRVCTYPDPAGQQRSTSAAVGQTDFTLLRQAGFDVQARKRTRSIRDGVNAVNGLLEKDSLIVSKKCTHTIDSLERLAWKEGSISNRYADDSLSHMADALRYPVEYLKSIGGSNLKRHKAVGF